MCCIKVVEAVREKGINHFREDFVDDILTSMGQSSTAETEIALDLGKELVGLYHVRLSLLPFYSVSMCTTPFMITGAK